MKRRDFLAQSTLVAAGTWLSPLFLRAAPQRTPNTDPTKKLVVIQLSGGNDGLNTVVPFRQDNYYKLRPSLALSKKDVLRLTDEAGLHPKLQPLQALYDEGILTILNNVGYPNPDRSHFRAMDIWHTASDANEFLSTGWLGRYLDTLNPTQAHVALELSDRLSLALKGEAHHGFALKNPKQLKRSADNQILDYVVRHAHPHPHTAPVNYLYETLIQTRESADYLFEQSKIYKTKQSYPKHAFGKDLKQVAELICSGTEAQVYYLQLSGFDTHANQAYSQGRLLEIYASGIEAFIKDLKAENQLQNTVVFTFSEFGRRVKENGSRGTDHGTATPVFLMGGGKGPRGLFNALPNLDDLDAQGDIKFTLDFRRVYATLLKEWLGASSPSLIEQGFAPLGLF